MWEKRGPRCALRQSMVAIDELPLGLAKMETNNYHICLLAGGGAALMSIAVVGNACSSKYYVLLSH